MLGSCVTAKRNDELQAREQTTTLARDAAEKQVRPAKADLQKANDALAQLRLTQRRLADDSTLTGQALRGTRARNAKLQDSYDQLLKTVTAP